MMSDKRTAPRVEDLSIVRGEVLSPPRNMALESFREAIQILFTIFKLTVDFILMLMILAAILLLVAPTMLQSNLLVVMSQSMEPVMPLGAVVITKSVPVSEIEVGNVITFHSYGPGGDALVTHRVVEVIGSGSFKTFRTKGDAVDEPDMELVRPQDVVGRVRLILPVVGYLVAYIRTPLGYFLVIGVPAIWFIAGELRNIIRTLRRKEKGNEALGS